MTADEIAALLARKQELDQRNEGALNMASYDRWVADALEALLKTIAVRPVSQSTTKPS